MVGRTLTRMAALAYLFPPLSGAVAYWRARSERTRWHGLQSVVFGSVWPLLLYVAAHVYPGVTQVVWVMGAVMWIALMAGAAARKDVSLPGIGAWLRRAASHSPAGGSSD